MSSRLVRAAWADKNDADDVLPSVLTSAAVR
jgi:hypothetical protein